MSRGEMGGGGGGEIGGGYGGGGGRGVNEMIHGRCMEQVKTDLRYFIFFP